MHLGTAATRAMQLVVPNNENIKAEVCTDVRSTLVRHLTANLYTQNTNKYAIFAPSNAIQKQFISLTLMQAKQSSFISLQMFSLLQLPPFTNSSSSLFPPPLLN